MTATTRPSARPRRRAPPTGPARARLQRLGDGRAAVGPGQHAHERDADLHRGEELRRRVGQRQRRLGHSVAVVGPLLEPHLAGRDDRDLRHREHPVGQEQHAGRPRFRCRRRPSPGIVWSRAATAPEPARAPRADAVRARARATGSARGYTRRPCAPTPLRAGRALLAIAASLAGQSRGAWTPDGPVRPAVGRRRQVSPDRHARRLLGDAQRRTRAGPMPCVHRPRPRDRRGARPAARLLRPALGARRPAARLPRAHGEGDGLIVSRGRRQRRALPGAGRGHQSSAALGRRVGGVVARWPAHRLRLGDAGPRERRRQRRSDGDHALPLQADGRRGLDALQRQPPPAHLRRRRRHARRSRSSPTAPTYEHSIDWSPNGDEILFVSNREADPDKIVQLRRLHRVGPHARHRGGSPPPRAPSTRRCGRPTARASRSPARAAISPRRRRRWRTRTSG